jgi:hypothetical protein
MSNKIVTMTELRAARKAALTERASHYHMTPEALKQLAVTFFLQTTEALPIIEMDKGRISIAPRAWSWPGRN